METTTKIIKGVAFDVANPNDPRARDIDIGAKIGLAQPRNIRALIKRLEKEGKLPGIQTRTVRVRVARKGRGEVEVESKEYWLTRAQALKVIAKCETDLADAILDEVILVYEAALDGLLTPTPSPEPALVARVAQLEASNAQILAAFASLPAVMAQAVEGAVERAVKAIVPVLPAAPDVSCIGPHGRRHIMASLRMYGRLMTGAKGGLTENQWTRKGEQDLRAALGFAGTGRRWELFPMNRFGEIQSHMDQLLNTARGVAGDRQAGAQLPLAG